MLKKRPRFFFKRSQKVIVSGYERQIVIPFRGISVFIIFLLLVTSVYLVFRSDLFLVHSVQVRGDISDCVTEDEIIRRLDVLGRSLVFLNVQEMRFKIQSTIACVGSISVNKIWPDKIRVEVESRKGLAVLSLIKTKASVVQATESAQVFPIQDSKKTTISAVLLNATSSAVSVSQQPELFLVDSEGFVFKKIASSASYLRIDVEKEMDLKIGQPIKDQTLLTVISFLNFVSLSLGDSKITGGQIDQKDKINLVLDGETNIVLSKDKDVKNQASSLQAILKEAKIEGAKIKSVDFNFDKPVLQMVKERTRR